MNPRPPRVSQQEVLDAAIEMIESGGADAFSMRKLGSAMGVDPMTIYHYVPNKAALMDLIVEYLWSSVRVDDLSSATTWQDVVILLGNELRRALLAHPKLVVLLGTRPAVTPTMLKRIDGLLAELDHRGLDAAEALRILDCVVAFVVGKVQAEVREPAGGEGVPVESVWAEVTPATHPMLVAAMQGGYGWDPDGEFAQGLSALVGGWELSSRE